MTDRVSFTSPVGRQVGGDVYKGNTTDIQGNPLVVKTGVNAGQAKVNFYIGLAVAKSTQYMINATTGLELTNEEIKAGMQGVPTMYQTWEETPWGKLIIQVARAGVPNAFDPNTGQLYQGRSFAFKVTDGDSQILNQNNKRPCDKEGYPGNWVLNFSNGFAPRVCNADGTSYIIEPDAIKPGYYIQVMCNVGANNDARNPGVYLNHDLVALSGYGEEIQSGIDMSQAGFGGSPLPAGASAVPLANIQTQTALQNQGVQQNAVQQNAVQQNAVQQNAVQQNAVQNQAVQQNLAPPPPANDLVEQQSPPQQIEAIYLYNGQNYAESVLLAMPGWTQAHLAGLQRVS